MATMTIRHAIEKDYPRLLAIYQRARQFMRQTGNPRQWGDYWPPEELVWEDIQLHRNYVVEVDGIVQGVFMYAQGIDIEPTYRTIYEGAWSQGGEYGVVHRMASSGEVPGVGRALLDWAFEQCPHQRIDTHGDNLVMQRLLPECGYEHRGTIFVEEDDDPRMAYERLA